MRSTTDSRRLAALGVALGLAAAVSAGRLVLAGGGGETHTEAFERVVRLFEARCLRCHGGYDPEGGFRLEREWIYRETVNVPSTTDREILRVDPGHPDSSMLWLKLLPQERGRYRGPRMPLHGGYLDEAEIAVVAEWIASFDTALWARPVEQPPLDARPNRTFHNSHIANLPTPETLGAGTLEFRILHRFKQSAEQAKAGDLFGLDSGAWISFGLAYGVADGFDVGLRRTNRHQAYEAWAKWRLVRQRPRGSPVSFSLLAAASRLDGASLADVNRDRAAAQIVLARRFGRRLSLELAPTYVTHTNPFDGSSERGTTALGVGGELRLNAFLALAAEWIPQITGLEAPYESASVGLSIQTSRHVFQLLVSNTEGAHTDLYAPGGDLDLLDGDFRLGFNITRLFDVAPGSR